MLNPVAGVATFANIEACLRLFILDREQDALKT
jgi:hypothetical protein